MTEDTRTVHIKGNAKELVIGTNSKITMLNSGTPSTPTAGSVSIGFNGTNIIAKNEGAHTSILTQAQVTSWSV